MRIEDIEDALRRHPTWDPPSGFAHRVVRMARPQVEARLRLLDILALVPQAVRDAVRNSTASLDGLRWTLRQYWLLIAQ